MYTVSTASQALQRSEPNQAEYMDALLYLKHLIGRID